MTEPKRPMNPHEAAVSLRRSLNTLVALGHYPQAAKVLEVMRGVDIWRAHSDGVSACKGNHTK